MRECPLILATAAMLLITVAASETVRADEIAPPSFFETRVRPILVDNCVGCHGPAKQKGGLRLDTRIGLLKGGKDGAVFSASHPERSKLLTAIQYHDPDLQMPPDDRLPPEQMQILDAWVKQGVPWPQSQPSIAPPSQGKKRIITAADRNFWSLKPVAIAALPSVKDAAWCRNAIDRFVLAKLEAQGLAPSPRADRLTLIRRATFDLTGLGPTPQEAQAFLADQSPGAYDRLIDRLLASPRYGERWGRHWLDVVRYAESDGFKQDSYRPGAWPYRDYVIRSLNEDKPYDRFITEQLAGDELGKDDPNVIVATGFLRAGLYEYNQRDVARQWDQMLTDETDVTADAFLGLSIGCARCHDHKFDPILQTDYFRMKAFFAPMLPRNDLPLVTAEEKQSHDAAEARWHEKTADLLAEMAPIENRAADAAARGALAKLPPEVRAMIALPRDQRTALQQQLTELALRQVFDETDSAPLKISAHDREKYAGLKARLAEFDALRPKPLFKGLLMTDVGPVAPPTSMPGDEQHSLNPGFPVVLDESPVARPPIIPTATSTGRRLALARWIAQPANPLTARVMVNRLWQHHFGKGLVVTSGDFGHLGAPPTHPELLDYLAANFVDPANPAFASTEFAGNADDAWRLKRLHRLIMTSAAYQQSSLRPAGDLEKLKDPDNRWLWRMNEKRLSAEEIRDAMLAISGELKPLAGGPSMDSSAPVRSIYTRQIRNHPDPLLEAFDAPESFGSVANRNQTTTPTQALLLINGQEPLACARSFADRLKHEKPDGDPGALIDSAYQLVYCRPPNSDEREAAVKFLTRDSHLSDNLVDLCHVLLNSSEFLYLD